MSHQTKKHLQVVAAWLSLTALAGAADAGSTEVANLLVNPSFELSGPSNGFPKP